MSGKRVFLLAVSLVFLMSLFSGVVFAKQHDKGIGESLRGAADTINRLFGFIPEILTLENVMNKDAAALFWVRFIIWIALFAGIYFGASFVFQQNKRIAVIVALAFSLLGATGIPTSALTSIFQTYGVAASFIVWFVPILAGLYISHVVGNRWVKAVIYLLLLILLGIVNKTLTSPGGFIDAGNWASYLGLLWAVIFIAFLWNLFAAFGGGGAAEGAREHVGGWFGDRGRNFGDWVTGGRGERGEPEERRERARDRERGREEERLEHLDRDIDQLQERLRQRLEATENDEIARLREIARLIAELDNLQRQLGFRRR